MNKDGLEIERRFLIQMPDIEWLKHAAEHTEITQTYLARPAPDVTARVRKRGLDGSYVYTHTEKTRLSDMSRREIERQITAEEYTDLLGKADRSRRVIQKTRYCLPYRGQTFEIDVFPFWQRMAIMEIELESEGQSVLFPPQIVLLREVTSDRRYTNASLAKCIPEEEI